MPTSSFEKEFRVLPEKAEEFVQEMIKETSPTLRADFHSRFVHAEDAKRFFGEKLNREEIGSPEASLKQ